MPRCCPAAFSDNVLLGHRRDFDDPVSAARLARDIDEAGGKDALVGHRGVGSPADRSSGLHSHERWLLTPSCSWLDDVSSALDAATEIGCCGQPSASGGQP